MTIGSVYRDGAKVHALEIAELYRPYFTGNPEKTLEACLSKIEEEPNLEITLNAVVVAKELGEPEKALEILERCQDLWKKEPPFKSELAWTYFTSGQIDKAEEWFGHSPVRFIEDRYVGLGRAWLDVERGNLQRAVKDLFVLARQNPNLTIVAFLQGILCQKIDKIDDAVGYFEETIKKDSHFVEARPYLASLFEAKRNLDQAWKQYVRVSYADSMNNWAKRGMKRLSELISGKPEEIIKPREIETHSSVPGVSGQGNSSMIRVGIGSSPGGNPNTKKTLVFRTATPFSFVDPDNNKKLLSGGAKERWGIRLNARGNRAEIIGPDGLIRGKFFESIYVKQDSEEPVTTILNSLSFAPDTSWGGMADKEIRGVVEIRVHWRGKTLVVVNHLRVEDYLYGVLAAEMPIHWPIEALKAQAVVARTQAFFRIRLHRKFGYDICDEQHCQVYSGVSVESPRARSAVDETRGKVLRFEKRLAHTVFSSNCGGSTQTGEQAGWGNVPYWQRIYDGKPGSSLPASPYELKKWLQNDPPAYCEASKNTWHSEYRWTRVVLAEDIAKKLLRKKKIGTIHKLQVLKRNESGRVQKIKIMGALGNIELSKEHEIRKYLGIGSLRSTLFFIEPFYSEGNLEKILFMGGGWGHGVGLCQSGAAGRAEEGSDYIEILKSYFPGTELVTM